MGGRGASNGKRVSLGRTVAQDKTINKISKRTRELKNEQYRIVDKDGNVLLTKQGIQHQVEVSVGEKREFLSGNISIHNHPNIYGGGTFSPDDIKDFGYGAKEIVAVAREGNYRLVNVTKDRVNGNWMELKAGLDKIWQEADNQSSLQLRKQAQENLKNSTTKRQLEAITETWDKIQREKGKEAGKKYLDSVSAKFTELEARYKEEVSKEARRLEVEPYHEYLKKNAKKYGFRYIFEKR